MTTENGMLIGAEAAWDAPYNEADRLKVATDNAIFFLREERIERRERDTEILQAFEIASNQLLDELRDCLNDGDIQASIAILYDILSHDYDRRGEEMARKELGL